MLHVDLLERVMQDWHHYVPFACLVTKQHVPENRPATTRLIEQAVVGIVAAGIGSYVTLEVNKNEIKQLKEQRIETNAAIRESEARVTAQISELRSTLLRERVK